MDDALFPGNNFVVRIGEKISVPAAYDLQEKAVTFTMPPYDPATMGSGTLANLN